jgi:hypothetical protein
VPGKIIGNAASRVTPASDEDLRAVPRIPKDKLPPLPSMLGARRKIPTIRGEDRRGRIVGEIRRLQSTYDNKVLVLHRLRWDDGSVELRVGYYMIGVRPGARNRWTWGESAPFLPSVDFAAMVKAAEEHGWLGAGAPALPDSASIDA